MPGRLSKVSTRTGWRHSPGIVPLPPLHWDACVAQPDSWSCTEPCHPATFLHACMTPVPGRSVPQAQQKALPQTTSLCAGHTNAKVTPGRKHCTRTMLVTQEAKPFHSRLACSTETPCACRLAGQTVTLGKPPDSTGHLRDLATETCLPQH